MRPHLLTLMASALTIACLAPTPGEAIVGGGNAPRLMLRGVVRVDLSDDVCSGSLVAARLVLTALHCLQAPQDGVSPEELGLAAIATIGNPNGGGRVQIRHVARVYVGPKFSSATGITRAVDAAVLVLDRATAEPPIPLAPATEVPLLAADGAPLLLAGFGATVSPPIALDGRSGMLRTSSVLKAAAIAARPCPPANDELSDVMCAGPVDTPAGGGAPSGNGCAGDSGAPILARSPSLDGAVAQVGTLSGATADGACSQATTLVFTVLNSRLATWLDAVRADPLPAAARAPRACAGLRRVLRRLKLRADRLRQGGRYSRAARSAARRRAQTREARVYRQC